MNKKMKKTKKKPNKPQEQAEFKQGDLVGAKLKGYPLWPGFIEKIDFANNRRRYTVRFFYSNDTSQSFLEIKHFRDFTVNEKKCNRKGFKEALRLCQEQSDAQEADSEEKGLEVDGDNGNENVGEEEQEEADDGDKMLVVVEDQSRLQSEVEPDIKPKIKKKRVKQQKKKAESEIAESSKVEEKNEVVDCKCDDNLQNNEKIPVSTVQPIEAPGPQKSVAKDHTNIDQKERLTEVDKMQSDDPQSSPPDPVKPDTTTSPTRDGDDEKSTLEKPSPSPLIDEGGDVIENSKSPKSEGENVMVTSTSVTIAKLKEKVARKLKEKEARKSQLKEIKLTQKVCKKLILYSKKLEHFSRLTSRLSRDAKITIEEWDSGFKKFGRVMENLEKLFCKCSGKLSNVGDSRRCHQTLVEIVTNLKTTRKNKRPTDFVPKVRACLKMIESKGAVNKFIHDEGPKNAMTERKENDSE